MVKMIRPLRDSAWMVAPSISRIDFYDALAAEKNMTLQQTGSGNVKGDPAMLRRALSNLNNIIIFFLLPSSKERFYSS